MNLGSCRIIFQKGLDDHSWLRALNQLGIKPEHHKCMSLNYYMTVTPPASRTRCEKANHQDLAASVKRYHATYVDNEHAFDCCVGNITSPSVSHESYFCSNFKT